MRRVLLAIAIAAGISGAAAAQGQKPAPAPNVTGKWVLLLEMSQGTATPALELKQDAETLTGTYTGRYGAYPVRGTIKGRTLQFGFTMSADGQDVTMTFKGEFAAETQTMKGEAELGGLGEAAWSAKRVKS